MIGLFQIGACYMSNKPVALSCLQCPPLQRFMVYEEQIQHDALFTNQTVALEQNYQGPQTGKSAFLRYTQDLRRQ